MCGLAGVIQAGEAPSAEDQELCIDILNGLLGVWSSKGYINPLQFVAGVSALANPDHLVIGTDTAAVTPDIVADPMDIQQVSAEMGTVVRQLRRISLAEYQLISVKTTTAWPTVWAYDWQQPNGTIWLYPRPSANMTLRVVGTPRILATASQSVIALDPSYMQPLIDNGAVILYDYFPVNGGAPESLWRRAQSGLRGLEDRAVKMRQRRARCAFATGGSSDSYWASPLNTVDH